MPLSQQLRSLLLSRVGCSRRNGRDVSDLETRTAEDFLLPRGVRRKGNIVLIATLLILALSGHHTNHAERQVLNPYGLPNGISPGKQIVGDGLSDHEDSRCRSHIRIGEKPSTLHRPFTNLRILLADTLNGCIPVHIAGDGLSDHE